ncbi:GntP family permease [Bacillus horti]|uniref:GntP family gluconate:H+ symporter n=1 Tax=Caldalkalibacillus horti TaxID=77523 RepID=A0ABT9VT46_9BACI|nr:GntP family permease [Bacillus horti]MDQ0164155.1 GntP family gluconate:H+ symporter [Bacillus horti]
MVEGPLLILVLVLTIVFIIWGTSKLKIHPFLVLLTATFLVGFLSGMPFSTIVESINGGFGGLMTGIGLVIVLGTIIGVILEKSGAALKMAEIIIRIIGEKHPQLAMSLIGALVSIPVFCDSGYVILSSLKKAMAKKANVALASMSIALGTGLYATHTLVPPTPGPIAAAGNIGVSDYLGLVIMVGIVVAIVAMTVGFIWAKTIASKIRIEGEDDHISYEDVLKQFGKLPSAWKSFAPLVVPIFLIGLSSIVSVANYEGFGSSFIVFLGSPTVALFIGLLFSLLLLPSFQSKQLNTFVSEGIQHAAPILLITGAGGALGRALSNTSLSDLIQGISETEMLTGAFFLLIPFLIAAGLKTAQGSTTAALVVTSALVAPLLPNFGIETPLQLALVVMAIGAGGMTVSHANDSYFWVVTQFSGMQVKDAYKAHTMATLLQGIAAFLTTFVLYLLFV